MKKLRSLSIFFPAYNDEKSIGGLVEKAYKVGGVVTDDLEVIVINDGSYDSTKKVLHRLQNTFPHLKIVSHPKNQGYGAALKSGFQHSSKEYVFYTDGDGQYDPLEITKLIEKMTDMKDVVNGFKKRRRDSILRVVVGSLYNAFLQKLYKLPISDVDCDFRLIRRSLLHKISLNSDSGMICLELIVKLKKVGARFAEVGVSHYSRKYGVSQFFTISHLMKTAKDHLFFLFDYKRGTI